MPAENNEAKGVSKECPALATSCDYRPEATTVRSTQGLVVGSWDLSRASQRLRTSLGRIPPATGLHSTEGAPSG